LADAQLVQSNFVGNISHGIIVAEFLSPLPVFNAQLLETIEITETRNALIVFNALLTNVVSLSDNLVALRNVISSISESASFSEDQDSKFAVLVERLESLVAADSLIGANFIGGAVIETITALSQVEGEHFIRGVVNEQVNTTANQAAVARLLISINERVNFSESSILRYLWNPVIDSEVSNFQPISTSSVPNWGSEDTAVDANFDTINTI
jgi:hypothetical protein